MRERWRSIPGFPAYEASDQGRIRRAAPGRGTHVGRILRTPVDSEGYPTVNLGGVPRRVHVLVALAWLGPIPSGGRVHHLDENPLNARASNLEMCASPLDHMQRHRRTEQGKRRHGQPNPLVRCACSCGARFRKYDRQQRPRRFVAGHNLARKRKAVMAGG